MHSNDLLVIANLFHSLATTSSDTSNSEKLDADLDRLSDLETFRDRLQFAEDEFKHIAGGSARVAYLTPAKTVLKIAKNEKGLAQNRAETDPRLLKSPYVNHYLRKDKHFMWIEVPYLEKLTEKEFEKITGINFKDFGETMRYALRKISGNTSMEKPEAFDRLQNKKFVRDLTKLSSRIMLLPGDLAKVSSWGHSGSLPILIDSGLTKSIFDKYYDSSTTSTTSG